MPVGTQATVKGDDADEVRATGADIVLGNTYHLMLRPGAERIAALGGLHRVHELAASDPDRFRRLPGDVAGAAAQDRRASGVTFRSHLDGAMVELTPERAIEIQRLLGADIAMQLDECVKLPAAARRDRARHAAVAALGRALQARLRRRAPGRALFGIVQGGDDAGAAPKSAARSSRSASTATPSAASRSASRRR